MKKYKLGITIDYDYDLVGLVCHQSDYRIGWALNEQLGLQLSKSEKSYAVYEKKGKIVSSHSLYEWQDDCSDLHYFLIKNKDKIHYLIPEKKQIDYFLAIQSAGIVDLAKLLQEIKKIPAVLTAYIFDPQELKSADRLVFE